jgi:ribonuclease P protein component
VPRKYSLRFKKDFDTLFKHGNRKYSKNFSVIFSRAEDSKFAFIISKKNAAKATDRNYSRRLMREIIRTNCLDTINTPFHIAIVSKTNLTILKEHTSVDAIQQELVDLFQTIQPHGNA